MKIISSKVLSYEEDLVEYDNLTEYKEDLDKRRKDGWTRNKKPDFYNERMEVITKHNNGKVVQRYKRYGALNI